MPCVIHGPLEQCRVGCELPCNFGGAAMLLNAFRYHSNNSLLLIVHSLTRRQAAAAETITDTGGVDVQTETEQKKGCCKK